VTVCGEFGALLVKTMLPARASAVIGLNVTEIEQLAPGARLAPHVSVSGKSPGLIRAMAIPVSHAFPVFVSVKVCTALVAPIGCDPKLRL